MKKITEQNKELERVAGGIEPDDSDRLSCPNCGEYRSKGSFSPTDVDSGCDTTWKYTCPNCGYSWVVD